MPDMPCLCSSSENVNREIMLEAIRDTSSAGASLNCPVRAFSVYLNRTEGVHHDHSGLFVSFATGKVGCPIVTRSLSSWLVKVIHRAYEAAGLSVPQVTGHCTRGMATSQAWGRGASVEDLCRATTWVSDLTFAHHYRLDLLPSQSSSISSHVLGHSRGRGCGRGRGRRGVHRASEPSHLHRHYDGVALQNVFQMRLGRYSTL